MDSTKLTKELKVIEKRLEDLRSDWVKGSPGMKRYIESAAKLYTEKRDKLKGRLE